jgi:hypothetical protein
VAGVFTTNRFCAAPVQLAKAHLAQSASTGKPITALVINTGNANAGTGDAGMANAQASCDALAKLLGCEASQVLPFSTGVILEPLPVDKLVAGLPLAIANLTENMVRANLAPWELMEALHRLRQMHPDLPTAELARASGRSSAHVSNLLRLRAKLCPELLEAYQEQGHLMHLGALLSVCAKEPAEQVGLYNTLVSGSKGGRPTGSTKRRGKNEPATHKQIQQMFRKARRESKERPSVFLNGVVYALLCVLGKERFELEVVE